MEQMDSIIWTLCGMMIKITELLIEDPQRQAFNQIYYTLILFNLGFEYLMNIKKYKTDVCVCCFSMIQRSQGSSNIGGGGLPPNYNIYDSWKTEWNGYSENSRNPHSNNFMDAEYLPSRRRVDYDPEF